MKPVNMEYINAQNNFFVCALIAVVLLIIATVINLMIKRRLNDSTELTEVETKRISILTKVMSGYGVLLLILSSVTIYYLITFIQVNAKFN